MPTLEQLTDDPHPHLARLRAESPVAWVPALGAWLVTGRDAALEVMRDAETFTVDDPRFTTGRVVGKSMLSLDGSAHDRHRAAFAAAFRPAATRQRMGDNVGSIATRLVGELIDGDGATELRSTFAAPLAAETIIDVLGLVDTSVDDVVGWYSAIVAAVGALSTGSPTDPDPALMNGVRGAVARSLARPDTSLADTYERAGLTETEFASNVAVVMFGALETSEAMIANLLWYVLGDAALERRLRAEPDLRDRAVDESLRLEPGAAVVDRYATREVRMGSAAIAAGDPVTVSLAGANRDPLAYDHPDRFSLERAGEAAHLAFAAGPHVCIGGHLARMEARAALDAILDGPRRARLDLAGSASPTGLVFRKPQRLTVTWNAGDSLPD